MLCVFGKEVPVCLTTNRFIWSKVLKHVKIQSYTTKNIIYLDVSTSVPPEVFIRRMKSSFLAKNRLKK